jgi:4-amino-4-deoxy-L-arabinose transferase-like glycosyltransferase
MSHPELATSLSALPSPVLVVLGAVALIQIGLDVFALVDLYRRPVALVALGNKWIWVAIILLVNFLGAILYLAIGRQPAPSVDAAGQERRPPEQVEKIVDSLYGAQGRPDDR